MSLKASGTLKRFTVTIQMFEAAKLGGEARERVQFGMCHLKRKLGNISCYQYKN
jgi:hypothetical protein